MTTGGAPVADQRPGALAEFVKWRIGVLDITPTELAERAKVSRSTVYRLLDDEPPQVVDTDQLHRFAAALEVDPGILAQVWHGTAHVGEVPDELGNIVRGFVLAVSDFSEADVRAALDIARQAVMLARRRHPND